MRIFEEEQLLNENFRKIVIDEIEAPENTERKDESKKRYDIFKDMTKKYVIERMKAESSDENLVAEIENRISNISFCRKIIEKKSLVYKTPPKRTFPDSEETEESYFKAVDLLNVDTTMKKTNKYVELFKNSMVQVVPYKDVRTNRFKLNLSVLPPHMYDVIEDQQNPEIARVVIFSYYSPCGSATNYKPPHESGNREAPTYNNNFSEGNGVNEIIADSPDDMGVRKHYVWWSNKFHFTTNDKGEVIPGKQEEDLSNPIGELPFVDFSKDKDGAYWALGGSDLIDGSILLNVLLTDLYYIAKFQGMGLFYLFGKGIPKNLRIGPTAAIMLEKEDGDPDAQIGFASSNPPIEAHLRMIEQYLAFLLSSNNMDAGSIKGTLTADNPQSGVQELIRKVELIEDITDQQEMYRDREPELFRIIAKYVNLYLDRSLATEEIAEIGKLDENQRMSLGFKLPEPYTSEKEQLEIIEKRMEIGLDSTIDALMRENSELSREDAIELYRTKMEERLMESSTRLRTMMTNTEDMDGQQGNIQDQTEESEQ